MSMVAYCVICENAPFKCDVLNCYSSLIQYISIIFKTQVMCNASHTKRKKY